MSLPIVTTLGLYILGMLAIGYYFYQKNQSIGDYFLGGRMLNPYVTALSAQASDMSGWLLLGLPGAAYANGLHALWIGIGLALGTYLNWQLVAKRLRLYTEQVDAITIADFFEERFQDRKHLVRVVSSGVILFFFSIYVASGLVAGGILFERILGIDYQLAVFLALIIVGVYTLLGGFLAVSWTDFFQGALMLIALLVTPVVIAQQMGGLDQVFTLIRNLNGDLLHATKVVAYDFASPSLWSSQGETSSFIELISLLGWGLGYFGMPHILVRFMGIRSAKELPIAQLVGVSWVVLTLIGALLVGLIGIVSLNPLDNPELVFIEMLTKYLNPWVAGIFLAAVLAAIMSTIDSQLLVASSALAEDFYGSLFRPQASERELLWVSRLTVLIMMVIGLGIAFSGGRVLDIVAYAWAGLGAAFGPVILFALYWKQTSRWGALAGIIVGGGTIILWKQWMAFTGLYELIPGFIMACLAIWIVSLVDPTDQSEVEAEYDRLLKLL